MPLVATKFEKLYLAIMSQSRSLTLVSFKRTSFKLVEYECEVLVSYNFKVIAQIKIDNREEV